MEVTLPAALKNQVDPKIAEGHYNSSDEWIELAAARIEALRSIGHAVDQASPYEHIYIPARWSIIRVTLESCWLGKSWGNSEANNCRSFYSDPPCFESLQYTTNWATSSSTSPENISTTNIDSFS